MVACTSCENTLKVHEFVTSPFAKRCWPCKEKFNGILAQWRQDIETAFTQEGVSKEMEDTLFQSFQQVNMPNDLGDPAIERLLYFRNLSEIRWGNVPIILVDRHLDTDERAHFELRATYYKPNQRVKPIAGRLIGTNKKCYFISDSGKDSHTIEWNNVNRVHKETIMNPADGQRKKKDTSSLTMPIKVLHISVTKGVGGGPYKVPDILYAKTMIDTLVQIWKRQLVIYKEQAVQGSIPEHVKVTVYQRDNGTCQQCGYQGKYIEYDHIIPRSKGGPNTVENIQLLCRDCNLKKGNRI